MPASVYVGVAQSAFREKCHRTDSKVRPKVEFARYSITFLHFFHDNLRVICQLNLATHNKMEFLFFHRRLAKNQIHHRTNSKKLFC